MGKFYHKMLADAADFPKPEESAEMGSKVQRFGIEQFQTGNVAGPSGQMDSARMCRNLNGEYNHRDTGVTTSASLWLKFLLNVRESRPAFCSPTRLVIQ